MQPLSGITLIESGFEEVGGVNAIFLQVVVFKFTQGKLKKAVFMSPHPHAFPPVEQSRAAIIALVCTGDDFMSLHSIPLCERLVPW